MMKNTGTAGVREPQSIGLWLRGLRVQSPSLTPNVSKTSNSADIDSLIRRHTTAAQRRQARRLGRQLAAGRITYAAAQAELRGAP